MYNKSEIMQRAWNNYNRKVNDRVRRLYWLDQEVAIAEAKKEVSFAQCLKYSWEIAISEVKNAQKLEEVSNDKILKQELENVEQKIFMLSMKDRMSGADQIEMRELTSQRNRLLPA